MNVPKMSFVNLSVWPSAIYCIQKFDTSTVEFERDKLNFGIKCLKLASKSRIWQRKVKERGTASIQANLAFRWDPKLKRVKVKVGFLVLRNTLSSKSLLTSSLSDRWQHQHIKDAGQRADPHRDIGDVGDSGQCTMYDYRNNGRTKHWVLLLEALGRHRSQIAVTLFQRFFTGVFIFLQT